MVSLSQTAKRTRLETRHLNSLLGGLGLEAVLVSCAARGVGHEFAQGAGDLDVVVGELAKLGVVETQLLVLGADAEGETGDKVHDEQNDAGHDEAVGETGDAIGQLVSKLNPVSIDPATLDDRGTVECGNPITGSEC